MAALEWNCLRGCTYSYKHTVPSRSRKGGWVPNKTIYVAEEDLALFTRAQELAGGNLSGAINQALQRYIEVRETTMQGLTEYTVGVGTAGARRRKRFAGHQLARWRHHSAAGQMETFTVYRTARGRFAVHMRRDPDWMDERDWNDPATWSIPQHPRAEDPGSNTGTSAGDGPSWWDSGEYTLQVYDSIDDLQRAIPPELSHLVEDNLTTPAVEDLDI